MILPIRKDAGSSPPLLGLALRTDGAGNVQTPLRALQKQIVHCIDPAALGMDTGDDRFFRIRTYSPQILHGLSGSLSYAPCTLGAVELSSAAKLHFANP